MAGFSHLTHIPCTYTQGSAQRSGAWTVVTAVCCKRGELYQRVFSSREVVICKKPNAITKQLKYILYSYTCICIPLAFKLFFPKKDSFTQGTIQYHQQKKESHAFSSYRWKSAAVKSEPSKIHTLSLIKK